MSEDTKLIAKTRTDAGSAASRRMRRAGRLPAVLIGGAEPIGLELDTHAFSQMLRHHAGENLILDIELDGKPRKVLLMEVQRDHVSMDVIHADFKEVSMTETLRLPVPIELVGTPLGVVEGGMLDHLLRAIDVECLASDVVDRIEVDVSAMDVGDSVLAGDVTLPAGMTLATAADAAVASILAPRVDTSATTEEAEEGAEAVVTPAEEE